MKIGKFAIVEIETGDFCQHIRRVGTNKADDAAPVRDHSGKVIAAMTVAGPTDRMPQSRLLKLAK